jgi:hypothetical protein
VFEPLLDDLPKGPDASWWAVLSAGQGPRRQGL